MNLPNDISQPKTNRSGRWVLQQLVIDLLLDSSDGMTLRQLSIETGREKTDILAVIQRLKGTIVYVDRWEPHNKTQWAAVYMCVKCPEDCPKPE